MMPLDTQTYDIEETIWELEADREDVAEDVADADPESNAAQQLVERGQRLDRYIAGLSWYQESFDAGHIALGALTNGERHRVRDAAQRIGDNSAARQNAYVALGTVDADYLEHEPENVVREDYEDTIANVADLHPAFVDWAESKMTELGRMDGDTGNSFEALVLEKRMQQTSAETNG